MELAYFIDKYTNEVSEDRFPGAVIHFGSATGDDLNQVRRDLPEGFSFFERWSTPFRWVWMNSEHRRIITVIEGDVDVTRFPDHPCAEANWQSYLVHANEYYKDN